MICSTTNDDKCKYLDLLYCAKTNIISLFLAKISINSTVFKEFQSLGCISFCLLWNGITHIIDNDHTKEFN